MCSNCAMRYLNEWANIDAFHGFKSFPVNQV